jgi:AhpD family alkylhydroperoxidase
LLKNKTILQINLKSDFMDDHKEMYPQATAETAKRKADLAPKQVEAWRTFSRTVFKEGVLDEKTKQLIAVAVAHVTQCPYCIKSHVPQALRKGATKQEIMEAIWVAAEMRAGAAYAHGTIALEAMENEQ